MTLHTVRCALWHHPLIKKMPSRLAYSLIGCLVSIDSLPSPKHSFVSIQLNTSQDNSHEAVNRVTHLSPSWSKRNWHIFWPSSVVGGKWNISLNFCVRTVGPSWGTAGEYWEAFRGWSLVGGDELLGEWVGWLSITAFCQLSVSWLRPHAPFTILPQWRGVSPSAVRQIKFFLLSVAFVRFLFVKSSKKHYRCAGLTDGEEIGGNKLNKPCLAITSI